MRWSSRGLSVFACLIMCAALCAAQSGPQPRAAVEQSDTYCLGCPSSALAELHPRSTAQLIDLARTHSPLLRQAIEETYPEKALELGRVWSCHLHDFFFAVRVKARPMLVVDDRPGPLMQPIEGTDLWYAVANIDQLGALHDFHYQLEGKEFGGSSWNMPAFTELSYPVDGAVRKRLSEKKTLTSKIFEGVKNDYWVYIPAGYDPRIPAALMVFLDGGNLIGAHGDRILDVVDNLIHLHKIPKMLVVFLEPGKVDASTKGPALEAALEFAAKNHWPTNAAMRSVQEDVVTDTYPRFLRDELLPAIAAEYNIRSDGYSHAIAGLSSGGLAAFNAAWQMPEEFSRSLCGISSFTSIQWKTRSAGADGGQDYPDKVLREDHRNIRVWLQDGAGDLESDEYGSWPLNNVRMANALKLKGYDFHFSFGKGGHGSEQFEAQFPKAMTWLWRDYDPSKTKQTFEIEATEKAKPPFRVAITNRDAD